ncbi:uncharacterized protein EI90DRAFT_3076383, partial [Cantharellus anzutake]|uniref:uncharacterized protein n=1 Tax=Cantharellus anzutake TaxID=1750568 RepID=UPI001907FEDA
MAASLDSEIHDEISRLSLNDDLLDDQVENAVRQLEDPLQALSFPTIRISRMRYRDHRKPAHSKKFGVWLNDRIREERQAQLEAFFRRNFRGDSVTAFLQALDSYGEMYNSDFHYGRSIPILQSSGTGKSRLVAEVLKRVYRNQPITLVKLCTDLCSRRLAGWPPRDEAMCRFVQSTDYLGEEMAAALLGALFKEIHKRLDHNPKHGPEMQMTN